jgi:hypothetical protein
MDPKLIAIVSLRSLSLLFGLQGQATASRSLNLLASGLESSVNVDSHLAGIAAALKSGQSVDWDDVTARIEADSARLQA